VRRMLSLIMLAAAAGTMVPAAAVAGVTRPPSPRQALKFGVRLVDVPVSDAHNPRGLRYIIDYLHTGTTIHRRIFIQNDEPGRARFTVYPDAAHITGGYFIGDAGHTRSELTTWISAAKPVVRLRSGASTMDMITIKVPRHATKGEHYGVIWVQQTSMVRNSAGYTVREIVRIGIRIYLAVGQGGAPPTRFKITSIVGHRTAKGRLLLTADVHNTGGRAVDLSGTAKLTDGPGNISAGALTLQRVITLAPGQSGIVTFIPSRLLPLGPWLATVHLVSGLNTSAASATISFSNHAATTAWIGTAAMIGSGTIMVILLLLVALRLRRVRRAGRGRGVRRMRQPRGAHA
jgi:hypothetical protein